MVAIVSLPNNFEAEVQFSVCVACNHSMVIIPVSLTSAAISRSKSLRASCRYFIAFSRKCHDLVLPGSLLSQWLPGPVFACFRFLRCVRQVLLRKALLYRYQVPQAKRTQM